MYEGSCLCGEVRYQLTSEPLKVSHCHCTMCQKQHGAAFATYASLPQEHLIYTCGENMLATYESTASITRRFCSKCGSNIEWRGSTEHPDWVSVTMATLDSAYQPASISNIHEDTRDAG